jgi:hypothetical protein
MSARCQRTGVKPIFPGVHVWGGRRLFLCEGVVKVWIHARLCSWERNQSEEDKFTLGDLCGGRGLTGAVKG